MYGLPVPSVNITLREISLALYCFLPTIVANRKPLKICQHQVIDSKYCQRKEIIGRPFEKYLHSFLVFFPKICQSGWS